MGWEDKLPEANGEWRIKDAEFKGYAKAQFDSVHDSLLKLERKIDKGTIKCDKNTIDITSLKAQAAMISLVTGAVISASVAFIIRLIGG